MQIATLNSDRAVLGELGRRLAHTRLERNWSQAKLADEAGISKTTIERIEHGEPVQLNNFVRILRALGQLDELDRVVPEPLPSPIERLSLEGKRRKRASGHRGEDRQPSPSLPWRWGDEESGI